MRQVLCGRPSPLDHMGICRGSKQQQMTRPGLGLVILALHEKAFEDKGTSVLLAGPQVSRKEKQVAWFLCCPTLGRREGGSSVNDSLLEAWYLPAHRFLQHVLGTQFPFLPFIFIFIYLVWSWLWHLVTAAHKLLVVVMWGLAPQLGIKPWPLPWEQSLSH